MVDDSQPEVSDPIKTGPLPPKSVAANAIVASSAEDRPSPWIALVATVGVGLVALVGVQVLMVLFQGFSLKTGQWGGVPDDLLDRIGLPFAALGAPASVFLILAIALIALPDLLGEPVTPGQDRTTSVALTMTLVIAALLMVGAALAARGGVRQFVARNPGGVPIPVMVQFMASLIAALGAGSLAFFFASGLRRLRRASTISA
ncbi:MAG: hypothetical protein ACT4OS_10105 [Acidimicrobiales bacterium]